MELLVRQALIIDPASPFHQQKTDVLLRNGLVESIGTDISSSPSTQENTCNEPVIFPGFTDVFAHFADPGEEFRETIESGAAAAAAGGYCRVMVAPNTQPAIHSKSEVEYLVRKSKGLPAQMLPIAAITRQTDGKELAEMHDMRMSGAVAFSDGSNTIQNSQVMLKALQYVKAFGGTVIQIPNEKSLSRHGLINEGIVSTLMGLPGKPVLAETLLLQRDIELLRYTQSRLHVTGISSAQSIELIRRAKNEGLNITCSVTPYHLTFTDNNLRDYDTNKKVEPPLRTEADRQALIGAVLDGTVDAIASHHDPQNWDHKTCEFEYARYGMETLECCVAATIEAVPGLSWERVGELFSFNPAKVFNLPQAGISNGAAVTLLDADANLTFTTAHIYSASRNNAFLGRQFRVWPQQLIDL